MMNTIKASLVGVGDPDHGVPAPAAPERGDRDAPRTSPPKEQALQLQTREP